MDAYVKFLAKVPAEYVPRIEAAISHAAEVLGDINSPSDAYQAVQNELSELDRLVQMDVAEAWKAEILSRLKKSLIARGLTNKEAEELLIPKIIQIRDLMETCRLRLESVIPPVRKYLTLKLAAFVSLTVAAFFVATQAYNEGQGVTASVNRIRADMEISRGLHQMRELTAASYKAMSPAVQIPPDVAHASNVQCGAFLSFVSIGGYRYPNPCAFGSIIASLDFVN